MSREMRRQMRRDQQAQEKAAHKRPPVPTSGQRRERVKLRQFIREIQGELRRVIWPSAQEVITYSIVVVVIVTLLTGVVFLLDYGFSLAVVELFRPAATP